MKTFWITYFDYWKSSKEQRPVHSVMPVEAATPEKAVDESRELGYKVLECRDPERPGFSLRFAE